MSPLRVAELLERADMTAYQLAQLSEGRISKSAAYRMAAGEVERLSGSQVAALCEVLRCKPGDLFGEE